MAEENKDLSNMNNESENAEPVVEQPAKQPTEPVVEPATEQPTEQPPEQPKKQPVVSEETVKDPVNQDLISKGKWFVIQVMTGDEDKVKQALELTIKLKNLRNKVFQVLVPTEEIVEIKGGKRREKVRKMFPGYVFLHMLLDDETWYQIRETHGVARFIGTKVKPTPVSEKEMQRVLKQLGKEERLEITFEKGEGVRVISGPFRGYTGTVDEVNAEKGKLKILINIFGRDTPVEVNFEHAQKIV